MKVSVYNQAGKVVDHIEISDMVFATPFNESVVHQAMLRQHANARQGTASTKTRSEVSGSSRKLFKQKGTGNARAGSIKSGLRPGGGILFGPKPRDYRQAMPKKMRQLALRCVLSAKARDEELKVLKDLSFDQPKTKEMAKVLEALEVESSALIVTDKPEENVVKSARNISGITTTPAGLLNVVDILSHRMLLMTVAAVRNAEELWGKQAKESSNESV
ncbi:MAG: 50S ribosomal protein L4 [Chloroflexi bacterium RBG_16_51_9]|nr:MAG: 50S ribosomal protein L4 [Chloroflexi bacterium RBG_16_51_9]